jgi:dihydroorotate dehydrogenase
MGFNNDGTELIKKRLKKNFNVVIGGNIGKNKITPNSDAKSDYVYCFKELYNQVDYFVVNVSSPNTPGLRELQSKEFLNDLFYDLNKIRFESLNPKPILLKISPDLNEQKILEILDVISVNKIDGIIATNTSVNFPKLNSKNSNEKGGLSGAPIYDRSNEVISFISKSTNGKLPIIGVGGISSVDQAIEKIKAGAHLIQIYTGLIYEGPGFIKRINKELLNYKL